jgi:hypothetical protein
MSRNFVFIFVRAVSIHLILLGLLTGCGASARIPPTFTSIALQTTDPADPPTTVPSETPSPKPTYTQTPAASPTPTVTASPTPTSTPTPESPPVAGQVTGSGIILREGPSQLFAVLKRLSYHTPVSVLTAAPGREWFHVRLKDGSNGWIMAQYVQIDLWVEAVGVAPISSDWITVKGSVKDSNGQPVVNAYVVLYDSQGHSTHTRSWEDSYFYLFLPRNSQERWMLNAVRPACWTVAPTPACPGMGYFLDNPRKLQISGDQSLKLLYQLYRP